MFSSDDVLYTLSNVITSLHQMDCYHFYSFTHSWSILQFLHRSQILFLSSSAPLALLKLCFVSIRPQHGWCVHKYWIFPLHSLSLGVPVDLLWAIFFRLARIYLFGVLFHSWTFGLRARAFTFVIRKQKGKKIFIIYTISLCQHDFSLWSRSLYRDQDTLHIQMCNMAGDCWWFVC